MSMSFALHPGHDVTRLFQRLLKDDYRMCLEQKFEEEEYTARLYETDEKLNAIFESITRTQDDLITHVKKTAKLKFTLTGKNRLRSLVYSVEAKS